MGTVSAKKINDALAKARNVGITEEKFTIGDCEMVLRNLRPDEYTAAQSDCADLLEADGGQYLIAFQKAHVCRALVQFNGYSFRDIEYVEVEEEEKDPKTGQPKLDAAGQPKLKNVTVERYVYFRDYVLNTWGREAVFVAFRKFSDVQALAEQQAKKGITFIRPEETPEDMFRRLVGELKEIEDQVPEPMLDAILSDNGFMRKSTADQIKAAMAKADEFAREQAAAAAAATEGGPPPEEPPAAAPASTPPPPAPPAPPAAPLPAGVRRVSAEEIMRNRQPMNQGAPPPPSPVAPPLQAPSNHNGNGSPTQIAQHVPQGPIHVDPTVLKRAGKVANIEQAAVGMDVEGGPTLPSQPQEVATLSQKGAERVDIKAFHANVEQPPKAGVNPRFKPPPPRI